MELLHTPERIDDDWFENEIAILRGDREAQEDAHLDESGCTGDDEDLKKKNAKRGAGIKTRGKPPNKRGAPTPRTTKKPSDNLAKRASANLLDSDVDMAPQPGTSTASSPILSNTHTPGPTTRSAAGMSTSPVTVMETGDKDRLSLNIRSQVSPKNDSSALQKVLCAFSRKEKEADAGKTFE